MIAVLLSPVKDRGTVVPVTSMLRQASSPHLRRSPWKVAQTKLSHPPESCSAERLEILQQSAGRAARAASRTRQARGTQCVPRGSPNSAEEGRAKRCRAPESAATPSAHPRAPAVLKKSRGRTRATGLERGPRITDRSADSWKASASSPAPADPSERNCAAASPASLLLLDRYENSLFHIHNELAKGLGDVELHPVVADITDARRIDQVFDAMRPQVVFHAAGYAPQTVMEKRVMRESQVDRRVEHLATCLSSWVSRCRRASRRHQDDGYCSHMVIHTIVRNGRRASLSPAHPL